MAPFVSSPVIDAAEQLAEHYLDPAARWPSFAQRRPDLVQRYRDRRRWRADITATEAETIAHWTDHIMQSDIEPLPLDVIPGADDKPMIEPLPEGVALESFYIDDNADPDTQYDICTVYDNVWSIGKTVAQPAPPPVCVTPAEDVVFTDIGRLTGDATKNLPTRTPETLVFDT